MSTRVYSVSREDLEPGYIRYYEQYWWLREGLKSDSVFARHHYSLMFVKDPILAAL